MIDPKSGTTDDRRPRPIDEQTADGTAADRTAKQLEDGDAAEDPAEAERIAQRPDF